MTNHNKELIHMMKFFRRLFRRDLNKVLAPHLPSRVDMILAPHLRRR